VTRQELIKRFYDDLEAAERYREKQLDQPRSDSDGVVVGKFSIGQVVVMTLDPQSVGHVTGAVIRQGGIEYLVTWADSREESSHCDFELEAVEIQS
jgi:hypothetical protein